MRNVRALAFGSLVAMGTLASTDSRANGRFPLAQHLLVHRDTSGTDHFALRVTFGFLLSDDNGQSFRWVCEEALGYGGGASYDPAFALDRTSRLHVGLFDGLQRLNESHCGSTRIAPLESQFVIDLDNTLDGHTIVALSGSGGTSMNGVYRSDDDGTSFRAAGQLLPEILFDTLEMSRSNPQRIYVTGVRPNPRQPVFFRSNDGGATLTEVPFTGDSRLTKLFIAGIDPTQPNVVYVRGNLNVSVDAGAGTPTSLLLRSDDGGDTWTTIASSVGSMLGFAISDDGRNVWFSSPDPADGVQRSTNRGAWERVSDLRTLCLRFHQNTLYACMDSITTGYILGRSNDLGQTWSRMLGFADIQGAFTCPADAGEAALCAMRWPIIRNMIVPPSPDAGTLDASPSDASTRDTSASPDAGQPPTPRNCGACNVGASHPRNEFTWAWVAVVLFSLRCVRAPRKRCQVRPDRLQLR